MDNSDKTILHLCPSKIGSDTIDYRNNGYDVRLIGKDIGVETYSPPDNVYGVFANPPCIEFSYAKHVHGKGNYTHDFKKGLELVAACMRIILTCNPVWWVLENPAHGYLKKWLKKPKLIFDPWEYGDNYQKKTALWGKFNIPAKTARVKPKGLVKFSLLKSKDIFPKYYGIYTRQVRRSITPPGFTKAFYEANK